MGIQCNIRLNVRCLAFFSSMLLLLLQADFVLAQQSADHEVLQSEVERKAVPDDAIIGMPIDTGWVVLDGKFIAPPYIVAKQGADILLNGQRVMTPSQNVGGGREGLRRSDGRGERRLEGGRNEQYQSDQQRRRRRGSSFGAARIEQQLIQGSLVVIVTDVGAATIGSYGIPRFVETLESEQPLAEKVQTFSGMVERPAHSAVWLSTIESYRPDPRLDQIAEEVQEQIDQRAIEREQKLAGNGWFDWLMPMAAIGAVLFGVSVLLKAHRIVLKEPGGYRAWRHIDTSGLRSRVVLLLIGLLLLLNGLDLAFTLIAQQTGEFAELSPIGDRLITKPILLGIYKIAAVALGAGLLLYLRQRRTAEVAAWWMCAVYVLVLVRWVAVNTLIMT